LHSGDLIWVLPPKYFFAVCPAVSLDFTSVENAGVEETEACKFSHSRFIARSTNPYFIATSAKLRGCCASNESAIAPIDASSMHTTCIAR
jgi:hypothetical protein